MVSEVTALMPTWAPGSEVRVRCADREGHTRCPRYVRGHPGRVLLVLSPQPLPDDVVADLRPARRETVYSVVFEAIDLWGSGSHQVVVDLWESYLEPSGTMPGSRAQGPAPQALPDHPFSPPSGPAATSRYSSLRPSVTELGR